MNADRDRDVNVINGQDPSEGNEVIKKKIEKEKIKELNINVQRSLKDRKNSMTFDKWKDYSDFELEISPGIGREYPISIIRSPAGEMNGKMFFPFDELALENALKDIQIALLRSGGKSRQMLTDEEKTVREFGQKLFDTLLDDNLRSLYEVSLSEAALQGKGLRLKLRIKPPELAALPWEFLYDSHRGDYISLSNNTPLVHYLELPIPIQPLLVDPPLRILGMVASPRDLPSLDVKLEKQRVEEAIKDLKKKGQVNITWLEGQTWEDLQQAMRTGTWHIFHFIGHGGFDQNTDEGIIALADNDGLMFRLTATHLGRFLAGHNNLRLVLLNSCEGAKGGKYDIFSSTASILVRRGIPAVLAMQYKITDRAAIEFARAFYKALADGMPVDAAVAEARIAVSVALTNTIEWGTPVLYMRSPDGVLFEIQQHPDNLSLHPDEKKINTLILSAQQLYDTGKYSEAFERWNEVLDLSPDNEIALKGLKEAEYQIKEYCPYCKTQNVRRKKFCRNCGYLLYRTGLVL